MGRIFGSIAHCWNTRLRPPHLRSLMEALAMEALANGGVGHVYTQGPNC